MDILCNVRGNVDILYNVRAMWTFYILWGAVWTSCYRKTGNSVTGLRGWWGGVELHGEMKYVLRRLLYFLRVWTSKIIRMEFHPSGSQSQAVPPDPPTGLVVWKMHGICGHPDSHRSPCCLMAGLSQCQWEAVPALLRGQLCLSLVFNTRLAFCLLA